MFRNICANLLPRQVANQYPDDVLEAVTEVTITNEPAEDGVIRPTIIVVHGNDTSDTHRWQSNPNRGKSMGGDNNLIDHRPYVWVQTIQGEQLEAA